MTVDRAELQPSLSANPESPVPARFREPLLLLLPSARDVIFIFIFLSLLAGTLSNRPLADPDIGWHIRTGELMLATHEVPHTDPFSSTMRGQPWYAWEWLYDLTLGILYRACGLNGVVWLCAVIVAATFTLLLSQLLRRGTGLLLAIPLMLLAEAASMIHLFARPHIVSWLFVLLWFVALERWQAGNIPRWLPWFFPASTLLWINLHAGWLFGFALFAIYTLAALLDGLRSPDAIAAIRAKNRTRVMAWTLVASAIATLVNPYGWRLHTHIYGYLNDHYLMNRIAEFRASDFHGWSPRCFAAILLLTLVALAGRHRRVRFSHLLVLLLATYAGLLAARNLPVSSMLLVLIAGPLLWENIASLATRPGAWGFLRRSVRRILDFSDRMSAQELKLNWHLWPVVCAAGALAICLEGGWLASRQLLHARFDPKMVPAAAVAFLEQERTTEPVFSVDLWGGYLIYRLYPRRPVVVDDRHDLYGSNRFREILILLQGEPGWRDVLETWQIRTALLPPGSTLAGLLRELPEEWRVAYEDKVAVVFEKEDTRQRQTSP